MPDSKRISINKKLKIIVFFGSPNKSGHSAILLNQFLSNYYKNITYNKLFDIEIFYSYDLKIKPCIDCGKCDNELKCIYNDMDYIYEIILNHRYFLIIVSPLYFSSFPSPLKAMLDRFQLIWQNRKKIIRQDNYGILLMTGSGNYKNMFLPSTVTVRHFFNTIGCKYFEEDYLLFGNINSSEDLLISDNLKRIEKISQKYVKMLGI